MFVKTYLGTIINLALFEQIVPDVSESSDTIYIVAKSQHKKPETLAQFRLDRHDEAQQAFEDLFQALLSGETTFDMSELVLKR